MLADRRFEALADEHFSRPLKAKLSPDELRVGWNVVERHLGKYRELSEHRFAVIEGARVVDSFGVFENGRGVIRTAFGDDGQLTGLFFLPPEAALEE